jgi:hypothetical protein
MRRNHRRIWSGRGVSFVFSAVFLVFIAVSGVQAATWYVRGDGFGGDGTSWHEAFTTIQAAINAANSSDRIFVKKGTYTLSSTLSIVDKGPDIYGGFNGTTDETAPEHANPTKNPTIIDGGNTGRCMHISIGLGAFGAPVINGFTIRNGKADDAGTLSDYGGGVYIVGQIRTLRPAFLNCIFTNNYADRGGGAVGLKDIDADFINCTFWKNRVNGNISATFGGAVNIFNSMTPVFTNCIFYDNIAYNGGAIYNAGYRLYLWNSILWGNTAVEGPQINTFNSPTSSSTYIDNSTIQGGVSGAYGGYFNTQPGSVISSDPKWAGPEAGSFRLRDTSPCIDKGANNAPGRPTTDFEGNVRPVDGDGDGTATTDMGVDEFIPGAMTFGVWYVNGAASVSGDGLTWGGAKKTLGEAVTAAQAGDQIWVRAGTYSPASTINVTKAISIFGGFSGTETSILQRNIAANTVTVNGLASSRTVYLQVAGVVLDGITFTGSTFAPGMVGTFEAGDLITDCTFKNNTVGIYASAGTIIRASSFSENKNAIWVDGSAGTPVTIDGCSFVNNNNDSTSLHDGRGGGVYVHNSGKAVITSSVFKGNGAVMGGAVASSSALTLANCIFGGENSTDGNTATFHGGAVQGSTIQATGCTFRNNRAGGSGGGLSGGQTTITGGIFANNTSSADSDGGGGGLVVGGNSTITGVTFSGNSAATGKGGGALAITTANFSGCIFSGNNAKWGGGLDGNGRIVNSLFSGNSAQYGGGAYWARGDLSSQIVNSIFHDNSASYNGGGYFSLYEISATNTIFIGNSASYGGDDVYNYYGYPMIITYCRINQSPFAGVNGNIDGEPLFINAVDGNFRLQETSPCIDAGTLSPPGGLPLNDLAGNPRSADGDYNGSELPDQGVYEFQPAPVLPGDVNRSGTVNTEDAIQSLRVISGLNPAGISRAASIDRDRKIGLEEAIYILGKAVK